MALTEGAAKIFDFLKRRKQDYKAAFAAPALQRVLIDLEDFCRGKETCVALDKDGRVDERRTFVLEGRREVLLRIERNLNLTTQQLYLLATGKQFNPGENDDG